jgi:5-methylcytosine-specific restriction endonuclease McrA
MPRYEMDMLPEYTDEAILAEIRRVARLAPDGPLTRRTFDRLARANSQTPVSRFGGWGRALAKAGLAGRYSGRTANIGVRQHKSSHLPDAALLDEIRRVARKLGVARLRKRDNDGHSPIRSYIHVQRFGSWTEALRLAGIEPGCRSMPHDGAELFANMRAVWERLGKPPRGADMARPPSRISAPTYKKRFGGFRRAVAAFFAELNGGPPMGSAIVNPPRRVPRTHRDRTPDRTVWPAKPAPTREGGPRYRPQHPLTPFRRRALPLGLRFMVLERDRFRCAACGASPADDPTCKLHVDHIVPVAKGGETLLDNLRTLCAECNLGRGAGRVDTDRASKRTARTSKPGRRASRPK